MKKSSINKLLLIPFLVFSFMIFNGLVFPLSAQEESVPVDQTYEAIVVKSVAQEYASTSEQPFQLVDIKILEGKLMGKTVTAELGGPFISEGSSKVKVGDRVIVSQVNKIDGTEMYFITDFVRKDFLIFLIFVFLLFVLLVGGVRGIGSLVGLIVSFLILIKFIIPEIIDGKNPVGVVLLGSLIIIPVTLYLAHGFGRKITAALIGTVISLVITGLLALFFVGLMRLTGSGTEEAVYLNMFPGITINLQGLLLAGIIIGALGVLDDVTVGQSACVFEIHEANPNLPLNELYKRGIRVGRHHIASVVNTLVLAYAGASLPLLLIFSLSNKEPLLTVLNKELIASEVARSLIGSIGIISAVPITTFIAALFSRWNPYSRKIV